MELHKAYVCKLDEKEMDENNDASQWYVPHHPVVNPHQPEKVRTMWNAEAKHMKNSRNNKLKTRRDLQESLVGIILSFKQHQFALAVDSKVIFLHMKVLPQECRVHRFLSNGTPDDNIGLSEYTRHVFACQKNPTWAIDAFLYTGVVNEDSYPVVAKAIKRNFYTDDFERSVATAEETVEVYEYVQINLKLGVFKLFKWISNN